MLDDSGSTKTETFPTDDETEAFPSDQEEPDSTTNNPLLGNVQYHIQVLVFYEIYKKLIALLSSNFTVPPILLPFHESMWIQLHSILEVHFFFFVIYNAASCKAMVV